MITDQEILSYFLKSNGHVNVQRLNKISDEYRNYLENRYTDSQSLRETIKRIQYNIDIRPTCVICGAPVKFLMVKKIFYSIKHVVKNMQICQIALMLRKH